MTQTSPTSATVGEADRCCPAGLCAYRPAVVELYLRLIRALVAVGEDPSEAGPSALQKKGGGGAASAPGGSGLAHCAATIWDVQTAMRALRSEGREATPAVIAQRLCPWSLDE